MRRMTKIGVGSILSGLFLLPSMAQADGIDIGGKISATGNLSVISQRPDEAGDTDTLVIGAGLNYTTQSARFEVGAALQIIGLFPDDFDEVGIYTPTAQVRVNSNLLGPDENVLLYAGFLVGATIIDSDQLDDELGVFGPKFGMEFYVSPSTAIQIEDQVLGDTEDGVTNNFLVGFKFLF